MSLPNVDQAAVNDRGHFTAPWRKWLAAMDRAVAAGGSGATSLAESIAAIATALGSPDGSVANIPAQDAIDFVIAGSEGVAVIGAPGSGFVNVYVQDGGLVYAKLQDMTNHRVLGRNTSGDGTPEEVTLSQLLDWVGSAADGDILMRSGGVWTRLPKGSDGQVLTLASGVPSWAASGGGGSTEDTWANRPASPSSGAVHYLTDAPSMARWNGTAWKHRIGTTPVEPPVLADFSQVNFGTSSTSSFGPFSSIVAQTGAAYALRILDKAAPSTPYTIEAGFLLPQQMEQGGSLAALFGAGFRDSVSGKLHMAWYDGTSSLFRSLKFTSPTAALATYLDKTLTAPLPLGLVLLRFRDDGTNRYVDISQGHGSWRQFHSVARTDHLTANRVCVGVNLQSANIADRIHWVHWKEY